MGEQASLIREVIESAGERFNLLSALSTIPIGIPSFMAGRMPLENPLGLISRIDIDEAGSVLLIWIGLSGIGLVIGAYYQYWIAGAIAPDTELGPGWMAALRMVGFGLLIFVGGLIAGITVLIAITLATTDPSSAWNRSVLPGICAAVLGGGLLDLHAAWNYSIQPGRVPIHVRELHTCPLEFAADSWVPGVGFWRVLDPESGLESAKPCFLVLVAGARWTCFRRYNAY